MCIVNDISIQEYCFKIKRFCILTATNDSCLLRFSVCNLFLFATLDEINEKRVRKDDGFLSKMKSHSEKLFLLSKPEIAKEI